MKTKPKDSGMRFDVGDRVFIKSLNNKEGIVVGCTREATFQGAHMMHRHNKYDVTYLKTYFDYPEADGVQYTSEKQIITRINEDDLCLFTTLGIRGLDGAEWANHELAMFDVLEYAVDEMIVNKTRTVTKNDCVHSWNRYEGFTNSYDYCTICDQKKV